MKFEFGFRRRENLYDRPIKIIFLDRQVREALPIKNLRSTIAFIGSSVFRFDISHLGLGRGSVRLGF